MLDFLTGNLVGRVLFQNNESDFLNGCCKASLSGGEEDAKVEERVDDTSKSEIKEIQKENDKLINEWICKIRLSSMACIVILPCGHLCCCPQCISACKICPICRGDIDAYKRARTAGLEAHT